jgi:DNA polymerase-3 subunit epsilon/ATP-dependent DNA helicase DinG
MQERAGFENSDTLQLGSPFDYKESALLCVPRDMPEPKSRAYQAAVEEAILEAAITARGRTMALFTSHNAIQITANTIRDDLRSEGVTVLAQGIDGPPYQLLEKFIRNPQSVLLGTSSFWEGVDIAGDALRVLIVARLPFSVPSEPIFEARSESYENPFTEYAVPQAILRLRQGFGRLIRTRTDKGVVVILDNRIISKKYGKMFLDSLPPAKLSTPTRRDMKIEIGNWLKK